MSDADLSAPKPVRLGLAFAVALLHLLAVAGLIRAFAPDFAERAARSVVASFTVTVSPPEPSPTPPPAAAPSAGAAAAGAAGAAGRKAVPRAVKAPVPRIALVRNPPAPRAASTGSADTSGARETGSGTGAGGSGTGTGSGGAGNGQGSGGGTPVALISGTINSARDYPIASRDLRIGDYVIVWLTVGTDGRPSACKVARPSRDPAANAITCSLALQRLRFRPATNAAGQAVVGTYGWRQRWFYKEQDSPAARPAQP